MLALCPDPVPIQMTATRCGVIELHEDATWKLIEYRPATCKRLFTACLTLYGWMVKERVGIEEGGDE